MAFSRHSYEYISIVSSQTKHILLSVTDEWLFQDIFWVKLSYWLDELCLPGDFPVSLMKCLFKPSSEQKYHIVNLPCLLGDLNKESVCFCQNELLHDLCGHVTPLALVSALHDPDTVDIDTIESLKSRQSKWGATWNVWSSDTIGINVGVMWCHSHWSQYHVIPVVSSIAQWFKWGTSWLFWLCDAISTGVGITWFCQYHQWHHYIP